MPENRRAVRNRAANSDGRFTLLLWRIVFYVLLQLFAVRMVFDLFEKFLVLGRSHVLIPGGILESCDAKVKFGFSDRIELDSLVQKAHGH